MAKKKAKRKKKKAAPSVKLTAADLLALLADRHRDDVVVPECKNGPTFVRGVNMVPLNLGRAGLNRYLKLPAFKTF